MRLASNVEYVRDAGGGCPFCGSKNISAIEQIQGEGLTACCEVECNDCGKLWVDMYELAGYVPDDLKDRTKKTEIDRGMHKCENCMKLWHESELCGIVDIFERVAPGEIMPSGQCPGCSAVCNPLED